MKFLLTLAAIAAIAFSAVADTVQMDSSAPAETALHWSPQPHSTAVDVPVSLLASAAEPSHSAIQIVVPLVFGFLAFALYVTRKGKAALVAVCVGLCFSSVWAADSVQSAWNSIILRTGRGAPAGTNGFIRLYLPNGTNNIIWGTNGIPRIYSSVGSYTGFTGMTTWSNGNVFGTQYWFGGLLVGTNAAAGATPAP